MNDTEPTPPSASPRTDAAKVDAGWIIASHSDGEFVPEKVATELETELAAMTKIRDDWHYLHRAVCKQFKEQLAAMTAERDAALQLTGALTEQVKLRGDMRDEAIEQMNLATQRAANEAEIRDGLEKRTVGEIKLRGARSLVQQLVEALTAKRWPRKITMTEQHAEDLTDAALDAARRYMEAAE